MGVDNPQPNITGQQQRTSWSIQRVQLTDETGAYVAAGGGGGGGAATIADGADVTQGAKADPQATSFDTTPWSVISLLKGIMSGLPGLGQKVTTASQSVIFASDFDSSATTAATNITTQNLVPAGVATANSAVEITLRGAASIGVQVTGVYTGALSLQVTIDGTNWITVGGTPLLNVNTGGLLASITSALQSVFQADVGGFQKARITALAAVTGTATVTLRAIQGAATVVSVDSPLPTGTNSLGNLGTVTTVTTVTTLSGTTTLTPGTGAANLGKAEDAVAASGDTGVMALGVRRDALTTSASAAADYSEMAVDRFGAMLTRNFEKSARSFSAAMNLAAPAATPTDVMDLFGNGTTTVVVTRLKITGIQTTGGMPEMLVVKRSTANTVGTRVAGTAVPLDATDSAASSVPGVYTANPTTGTLVGALRRQYVPIQAAATPMASGVEFNFGDKGKGIILSGTAQGIAVNLNSVTLTGGNLDIEVDWYEF